MLKYGISWYQTCYKENLFCIEYVAKGDVFTNEEMKKIKQ